jgi:hypothetical protein
VALCKGATFDALARLREGVTVSADSGAAVRSRASLAYGIALAASGRPIEALLSTLDALARAREANEALGERACARFLRRLSLAAGHPGAALKWQTLAEQKTP